MPDQKKIVLVLGMGFSVLALIYIFQQVNIGEILLRRTGQGEYAVFVFNKTARLLLNDAVCFAMIYAIFPEPPHRRFAVLVFVFELFIILPVYLTLKLRLEGDSEISIPLLSFIHRLIVNPMLMILSMFALGYQKYFVSK